MAELQGNSALSGGVGAVSGELATKAIINTLYGGKDASELTEDEKQTISALSQLASGLAVAAGGGNIGDASAAISSSKNAVENNALQKKEALEKKGIKLRFELQGGLTPVLTEEEKAYWQDRLDKIEDLDRLDDEAFKDACSGGSNTQLCQSQIQKLLMFKEEYEEFFGKIQYKELLPDDYNKIIKQLDKFSDDVWGQVIIDYAKANNMDPSEAAEKFKYLIYMEKTADVVGLLYGIKGIKIVNGKLSAAELAKAEDAINEYNRLKNAIDNGLQTIKQQKTPINYSKKLPTGYSKQGDNIVGPRGGVYTNTGQVDAAGNAVYSNNGSYYTFENGVKTKTTSPNTNTGSQIQQNYQNGKDYEQAKYEKFKETQVESAREVTLVTDEGTKIRLDMIGRDQQGNISCAECKSSQTAPLTENQKVGFPELEKSGGVIVGEGKPGFEGGTIIPPTKVEIIRPNE